MAPPGIIFDAYIDRNTAPVHAHNNAVSYIVPTQDTAIGHALSKVKAAITSYNLDALRLALQDLPTPNVAYSGETAAAKTMFGTVRKPKTHTFLYPPLMMAVAAKNVDAMNAILDNLMTFPDLRLRSSTSGLTNALEQAFDGLTKAGKSGDLCYKDVYIIQTLLNRGAGDTAATAGFLTRVMQKREPAEKSTLDMVVDHILQSPSVDKIAVLQAMLVPHAELSWDQRALAEKVITAAINQDASSLNHLQPARGCNGYHDGKWRLYREMVSRAAPSTVQAPQQDVTSSKKLSSRPAFSTVPHAHSLKDSFTNASKMQTSYETINSLSRKGGLSLK